MVVNLPKFRHSRREGSLFRVIPSSQIKRWAGVCCSIQMVNFWDSHQFTPLQYKSFTKIRKENVIVDLRKPIPKEGWRHRKYIQLNIEVVLTRFQRQLSQLLVHKIVEVIEQCCKIFASRKPSTINNNISFGWFNKKYRIANLQSQYLLASLCKS